MSSTFGRLFTLSTFGESHGPGVGVLVDGMPPGMVVDAAAVQRELDRRRPGQSAITTSRQEADQVEIVSGVFDGLSTGAPILLLVRNNDQRSQDYDALKDVYRPGHADYAYAQKYGVRDHRGGGRSSGRETVGRVAAGALAKAALATVGVSIVGGTVDPSISLTGRVGKRFQLRCTRRSSIWCWAKSPDCVLHEYRHRYRWRIGDGWRAIQRPVRRAGNWAHPVTGGKTIPDR